MTSSPNERRRCIWGSTVGLLIGGAAYFLILFDFKLDPRRTAVSQGYASNFFDIQARAFMDGHLWVPKGSLGIEGFILHGHTYMYFPPFPALLRIPVMWVTSEFDGKLSLISMALAWIVFATMTVRLYWLVRQCLRPDVPVSKVDAVCAGIFIAAATGGTVLTFDASLPWVYHEVYLWAAALVVGTMYWLVRVCLSPTSAAIAWLGAFTLATILTRTTGGIAMCLAVGGAGIWLFLRRPDVDRRAAQRVMACAAVPFVVAIAYNTAKFGQPFLFPLGSQVWTDVNEHRRFALDANGGTLTGPQFFLTSFVNYLSPTGIRFVDYFPWITLPAEPARAYGGAIVDQTYRTGSITAFMPLLLILSLGSLAVLFRRGRTQKVVILRAPLIGAVLVTGGVMAYGYVANRYASEFVPALVMGGAIGMIMTAQLIERRSRTPAALLLFGMITLTAFSIAAQMATGSMMAAQTARGERLVDYLSLQNALSGGAGSPIAQLVTRSEDAPEGGSADQLHIRGNCDDLYLQTGDTYEPWILVAARDLVVEVQAARVIHPAKIPLFTIQTAKLHQVGLQTNDDFEARVVIGTEGAEPNYGFWFPFRPGEKVTVGLRTLANFGVAEVESLPGGFAGFLPSVEWDKKWYATPGQVRPVTQNQARLKRAGLAARELPGFPVPLCEQLAAEARTVNR